ncbi:MULTISPECIES: YggT family protein [Undibacterium]|uniref:YggT family protein n=1 Tax=Undibacterium TaxID=401469 RepID=UPI001D130963|nr:MULTISPECIES: YggT family protein [Undibacterium]MCX7220712.1 YggT family protein [Burkholderiales bacterium]
MGSSFVLYGIFSFITDTVAGLFAGFLLLRFWMQAQRVRPPAGLAQSIFQITDWLVRPIRRLIPGFAGYDWASLIAAFLVALLAVLLNFWLLSQLSFVAIILLAAFKMAQWILYGFMALLILEAVFSWVNPHAPFAPFIRALNEPILSPLRRLIPALGGIDFSPLIALIAIQVLNRLLSELLPVAIGF